MLYLVATPIGNLGDITLRALEVLRAVDVIASEDTRRTGLLLKHFGISQPQMAFHEHNEEHGAERIISVLREGRSVAVVTDAGTPGVCDPGFAIVRQAIAAELPFTMVPGPTGLIMALVLSGLPVHAFTFRGFPPRKPGPRRRFMAIDDASPHTLIFHESPYRLAAFLEDALAVYGDRQAALANDLTKLYEAVWRDSLSGLLQRVRSSKLQGEYIVVIAGAPAKHTKGESGSWPRHRDKDDPADADEREDDDAAPGDTGEPACADVGDGDGHPDALDAPQRKVSAAGAADERRDHDRDD